MTERPCEVCGAASMFRYADGRLRCADHAIPYTALEALTGNTETTVRE